MSETNSAATSAPLSYDELVAENQRLATQLANAQADIQNLIQQVRSLKSFVFGKKSEKLSPSGQESLFPLAAVEEEVPARTIAVPAHERTVQRGRKPLPHNLPIERIEYEPEEKSCSCCSREMAVIGEEITEELEYIPARFKRVQHVKIKRACSRCKNGVVQGVLPAGVPVIDKGRPGPGLLAFILISKYCDHLPLYRLEQIFARHGVEIPRQRMCDWIGMVAERFLMAIALSVKRNIVRSVYVRTDETELEVQTEEKDGKLHKGCLWGMLSAEKEVYFEYIESRSQSTAKTFLGSIAGVVQSDFCPAYEGLSELANITRAGCWDHARRKFFDAKEAHWRECQKVLSLIGELYRIEREYKKRCEKEKRPVDPADRLVLRTEKSRPVIEELRTYLGELALSVLPKSPLGKAIGYCLPEWHAFCVFLNNGLVELSNIAMEQQIRPIAVGRKNWLFAGSDRGAQWGAVMYSLFGSCRLIGVNPFDYTVDVLRRVPAMTSSQINTLTPHAWKAARDKT